MDNQGYDSRPETVAHARQVQVFIDRIREALDRRGEDHDESKMNEPELSVFDEYTPKLKDVTYGSSQYKEYLTGMQVALDHHYSVNRHHPEYFGKIADMNLVDIIEMLCDWKAATMRHADGDIVKSIIVNQGRFGLSDELTSILMKTLEVLDKKE